jgi:ABC-type lipoprotein export system ATPase subunit
LILADEPTGDVDADTGDAVLEWLDRAVTEWKAAWIVATHGPFPQTRADRVFRLEDGRLRPARPSRAGLRTRASRRKPRASR